MNKSAFQYSVEVSDVVSNICKPLKNLDITGFGYFNIFPDGRYLHITNGLRNFQKIYFEQINDLGIYQDRFQQLFLNHSQKHLWFLPNHFDACPITSIARKCGLISGIDIYMRHKHSIENFYFIFSNENTLKDNDFQKSKLIKCLEDFTKYFKIKAADIINCEDQSKLAKYKDEIDISEKNHGNFDEKISKFKEEINYCKSDIMHNDSKLRISNRERQVLEMIHMNSKEIGRKLNISNRTVECHISSLKEKTGIITKTQLINLSLQNNLIRSIRHS